MRIFSAFKKKEAPPAEPIVIKQLRPFPFTVDGANLRYAYDMEITPTAPDSIKVAIGDAEKIVSVSAEDGSIALYHDGKKFGTISDDKKFRMVSDFLKRDDPVNAVLRSNGKASLRFYRDMRKGAKESEIVELAAYKSKACQENLYGMTAGEELGCFDDNGKVSVCAYFSQESVIGKMPAKIVKRAEDEDIRAIYIEEIKEEIDDDGNEIYIPIVRVYW